MKKIFTVLCLCLVLCYSATVSATPLYLSINANVSNIWDIGSVTSSAGIKVKDTLSYVIKIDQDLTGSVTKNGNTDYKPGTYYASLISGNIFGKTGYNLFPTTNFGFDGLIVDTINAGNEYSNLNLTSLFSDFGEFEAGTNFGGGFESTYENGIKTATVFLKNITVTSVSNSAPTPVPSAILLMSAGLAFVGYIRKRVF